MINPDMMSKTGTCGINCYAIRVAISKFDVSDYYILLLVIANPTPSNTAFEPVPIMVRS